MATQIQTVANELRRRITSGAYHPGERVTELQVAAELGVSRTPVRLAFEELAEEGLLERLPTRGFRVRSLDLQAIIDAIDVRGTLEGMAARIIAERGLSSETRAVLQQCIDDGRALVEDARRLEHPFDRARWAAMNRRFHLLIVETAGNASLTSAFHHVTRLPLADPSGLVVHGAVPQLELEFILRAQQDHEDILRALQAGEGSRVESLMREHARRSRDNKHRLFQEIAGDRPNVASGGAGRTRAVLQIVSQEPWPPS